MKTRALFLFIASYIILAFGWWTWSLIAQRKLEALQKKELLIAKCEVVRQNISTKLYSLYLTLGKEDLTEVQHIISTNNQSGNIETSILSKISATDSRENIYSKLSVSPTQRELDQIEDYLRRKTIQYLMEGLVFMGLLIWGMVLIYRNIKTRLRANQQQNNFLLAVTHELKTPVASVKLMLQTLKRRHLDEDQRSQILEDSLMDIERLESLVENVLIATRMEGGQYMFLKEPINLTEMVEDMLAKFSKLNTKNQRFETDFDNKAIIWGDAFTIRMVFDNLFSNSIKYAPASSTIFCEIKQKPNNKIYFILEDEAETIKDEERDKIFNKFYRIGNENTRSNKGTGLGLFIVKQVLLAHQAEIFLEPKTPVGNKFSINFTKHNEPN
jgi:signal transduction histidine kinase